jgi:small subunit ribosomal protein S1
LTEETKPLDPEAQAQPEAIAEPAVEEPEAQAQPEEPNDAPPAAAEADTEVAPPAAAEAETEVAPAAAAASAAADVQEAFEPSTPPTEPDAPSPEWPASDRARPADAPADAPPDEPTADLASAVEADAEAPAADAPAAEAQAPAAASAAAEEADGPAMTMADLLDANEVKSLKHGDVVEGTVVRIDPDEILIDFGGKSEGVVSNRELMSRRGSRDGDEQRPELKIGDEVLVYVLQPESPEGHAVLSLRRAGLERKWRAMQERFDAGEIVEAKVIDHNKGGLIVDLGVRGFVPISQIVDFPRRPRDEQPRDAAQEIAEKLQPFVGRTLRLKILEVNRKANRLILSEKVALYEERREKRDELFSSLQVGQRVTGVVRSIAPFGVFVDLGGIDGLVHKSELSWNKVNNPETAHNIGDEVEAEVIDINHERGRISLSIRRLQPDPWQESVAKYTIGDVIEGTVTKLVNFGAFVRVEEGLEGLIHISELSTQRVAHPGDVVKEGEVVKLKIISLDSERHRLGLSLKQAEDRPAAPSAAAGAQPRYEDRPQRRERRGDRRDRAYRPEDAISEPDEGIDNTMAAAFAESGFFDQFRSGGAPEEQPATQAAAAEEPAAAEAVAAEEPAAAEAVAAEEPAAAEAVAAEEPAAAEAATTPDAQATTEETTEEPANAEQAKPAEPEAPEATAEPEAQEATAETVEEPAEPVEAVEAPADEPTPEPAKVAPTKKSEKAKA